MSRIIKFRAWDGEKMLKAFCLDWLKETSPVPDDFNKKALFNDNCIFLEFTGLIDKNGKEIFEGDILKVEIPNYIHETVEAEVKFEFGCFGIRVIGNPILNNAVGQFKAFNKNTKGVEVIGNIYENPELLKGSP